MLGLLAFTGWPHECNAQMLVQHHQMSFFEEMYKLIAKQERSHAGGP